MAKGFGSVQEAGRDIEERKAAAQDGDFPQRVYFKLEPGKSADVRFLEQGDQVQWAWVHPLDPDNFMSNKVVCRDQDEEGRRDGTDCPGCERDLPRKFRGVINLINRETNQVETWIAGPTIFVDILDDLDSTYKGLSSRDFKVKRRGSGRDTTYSILPADPEGGSEPLSKSDEKLIEEKPDLSWFVTPPSYEEWGKEKKKKKDTSDHQPSERSPFRRKQEAVA
jgi:hypothetical protein